MNIQIRQEAGTKANEEGRRKNAELERLPAVAAVPEWWATIPEGEKSLLHAIARMLRSAKRSELHEVARAAAKWERGIGCFIKVRLIGERRKAESRKRKWQLVDSGWVRIAGRKAEIGKAESRKGETDRGLLTTDHRLRTTQLVNRQSSIVNEARVTSCPSTGHSQPGAAPTRG
jgi:hypothetical protein